MAVGHTSKLKFQTMTTLNGTGEIPNFITGNELSDNYLIGIQKHGSQC